MKSDRSNDKNYAVLTVLIKTCTPVANNPIGPWVEGGTNLVLPSDVARNIIGPGHHNKLFYQKKYHIVYHRIIGVMSADANDLLREICINELSFDCADNINNGKSAQKGIKNFIS